MIDPVQMIHAGNYTCVAEIPGASSSKTLTLNVLPDVVGGPFAWPENPKLVRAQIGDDVDIECQPSSKCHCLFQQSESPDYIFDYNVAC